MTGSAMQHSIVLRLARLKVRAATGRSINGAAGAICGVVRHHQGVLYFQNVTAVSRYTTNYSFIYALPLRLL